MVDLKAWLESHESLFKRELRLVEQTAHAVIFCHQGLTDEIKTRIELNGEINVVFEHWCQCWDIVATFEVSPARLPYGDFYCRECEQPEYYDSELLLWEHHSLQEWAAWINAIGTGTHEIRLCGGPGCGFTSAAIVRSDEQHMDDDAVHTVLPVVVGNAPDG